MNVYAQILSITLGGLLSVSEILPFIRTVKTNGIIHFLIDSFVDCNTQDLEKLMEQESLLTNDNNSTNNSYTNSTNNSYTNSTNNSHTNSTNSKKNNINNTDNNNVGSGSSGLLNGNTQVQDSDKKLDTISSELRKLDIIDHNLQEYISQQFNNDNKLKLVIKDDINNILQELKDIKIENSDLLSNKYEMIVNKICDHLTNMCEHMNNVNTGNIKLTIDNIKDEINKNDIDKILTGISNQLREIRDEKTDSFSRKNVEEILEMILQHVRDLQRSQLQWTHNYGENNIKNDLKFENIIERIDSLNEMFDYSNKMSNKIIEQINNKNNYSDELKHKFKIELMSHNEVMNEQFLKQLNLLKGMTLQIECKFEEMNNKITEVTNKVDEILVRSNEYTEKKKKRSFLNGSG